MLSNKVITHCKNHGWWYDDYSAEYTKALQSLNINLNSEFAQFYLHADDGPVFYCKNIEIYHIC
jgi:hypothetical protein